MLFKHSQPLLYIVSAGVVVSVWHANNSPSTINSKAPSSPLLRLYHELEGHNHLVYTSCYVASRNLLITGGEEGIVRVWNLHTGKCDQIVDCCESDYFSNQIFSMVLVQLEEPQQQQKQKHKQFLIYNGWLKDNVYGPEDLIVREWNYNSDTNAVEEGKPILKSLTGHSDTIRVLMVVIDNNLTLTSKCGCSTKNHKLLLSASDDYSIKLWCIHTGKQLKNFSDESEENGSIICFSMISEQVVASANYCTRIDFWNLFSNSTSSIYTIPLAHGKYINAMLFTSSEQLLVTASQDGTVKIWKLKCKNNSKSSGTSNEIESHTLLHTIVNPFSSTNSCESLAFLDGNKFRWYTSNMQSYPQQHVKQFDQEYHHFNFYEDNTLVVVGDSKGNMFVVNIMRGVIEEQHGNTQLGRTTCLRHMTAI